MNCWPVTITWVLEPKLVLSDLLSETKLPPSGQAIIWLFFSCKSAQQPNKFNTLPEISTRSIHKSLLQIYVKSCMSVSNKVKGQF